ncbi:MAG: DUF2442 domain-containing protein [Phycisphaerae bacterium]|jgi:hypothetical protein
MLKDVVHVEHLGDYRLLLTFEGNEQREVDLAGLIPFDGVFGPLKDADYFRQVRVNPDVGTIVWPNGADLCPDVLYERSEPPEGD